MERPQLINVILPQIIKDGADRATADRIVEMKTTSELGILYARFVREGRITPPTSVVTDQEVEAERQRGEADLLKLRLDQAEQLALRRAERDADRWEFHHQQEPQRKAEAEASLARDRAAFDQAAKQLRNFTRNDANFHLCRQVSGEGNVSAHLIGEAISSGAIQLSKITQAELDEYRAEDVQAANQRLRDMNPLELKAEVRRESAERAQRFHEQESDRVLAEQQQADSYAGYPELPLVNSDGVKLDSKFFRRASSETIRTYIRRFGSAQITNAIRTRN